MARSSFGVDSVTGSRAEREGLAMDRLRANLRAAGIAATTGDLERLEADGYVERVVETCEILAAADTGGIPDFLAAWGPEETASGTGGARADGGGEREAGRHDAGSSPVVGRETSRAPEPLDGMPDTLQAAAEALRSGALSPVELVRAALDRIADRDPVLNLFQVVLADRALEAARHAEAEIGRGDWRGPLHGIPVAAKDLFDWRGTETTAGSKVRAGTRSDEDAAAVARLEAAGAIVVGKTRLSEFAYWPGSTNPHYGPTRNPHDPERDTGGSSSGSAAAVATGCVYAALGTDTGGSIRIPAALCGVVGHKPTFGRASLHGCVPLAWSLDHVGPMARTVEDASLVLEVLCGPDARDPRTRPGTEFRSAFGRPGSPGGKDGQEGDLGVGGVRIGVLTTDGGDPVLGSTAALSAWRDSGRALEAHGAELVEVDLPDMHVLWRVSALTLAVEAATYHAVNLRTRYEDYGRFCRGRLLGAFAYGFEDFLRAQRVLRRIRIRWERLWERIDVLSTPCQPDVAPALGVAASTRFTNPFNALGWPAVSVPFGRGGDGVLPLGTQFAGRPWDDAGVLRVAAALRRAGP